MDVPFKDVDIWCPVASLLGCTQLGKDMQNMCFHRESTCNLPVGVL